MSITPVSSNEPTFYTPPKATPSCCPFLKQLCEKITLFFKKIFNCLFSACLKKANSEKSTTTTNNETISLSDIVKSNDEKKLKDYFNSNPNQLADPYWQHFAAQSNALNSLKFLMANGVQETAKERTKNLLYLAARHGSLDVLQFLVEEKKYDINGKIPRNKADESGDSISFYALEENKQPHVIKYLLNHPDLKLNERGDFNNTLLHVAARAGNQEAIDILIKRDAKLKDSLNAQGNTPLHEAAETGKVDVIDLLISDSNLNKVSTCGDTPLDTTCSRWIAATRNNNRELADNIVSCGKKLHARGATFESYNKADICLRDFALKINCPLPSDLIDPDWPE